MRQLFIVVLAVILIAGFFILENSIWKVSSSDKNTIVVWVYPNLDVAFNKLLPEFHKVHPGIKVRVMKKGFEQHHNAFRIVLAAGGDEPDVAVIEIAKMGLLGGGGGLVDLLPAPYNAGVFKPNFVPYKWAQGMVKGGKLVGLPLDIAPGCIYYRKDVLDRLKINPDSVKTMDDYFELGRQLIRDRNGDGKPDYWAVPNAAYIFNMIFNSGQIRYFDAKGRPALDRPLVRTAMRWAKKFRDAGLDARIADWSQQWYNALKAGRVVYFPMGSWLNGHLKNWMASKQIGKFRVKELPALKKGGQPMYIGWGGSFMGINRYSRKKLKAWKFIRFVCTTMRGQMVSFKRSDAFPSWMPAWKDKIFDAPMPYLGGQKGRRLWIKLARRIPRVKTHERDSVANSILMKALTDVLNGVDTIDNAVKTAQKKLERRMKI